MLMNGVLHNIQIWKGFRPWPNMEFPTGQKHESSSHSWIYELHSFIFPFYSQSMPIVFLWYSHNILIYKLLGGAGQGLAQWVFACNNWIWTSISWDIISTTMAIYIYTSTSTSTYTYTLYIIKSHIITYIYNYITYIYTYMHLNTYYIYTQKSWLQCTK
jgi:hypothetical protein